MRRLDAFDLEDSQGSFHNYNDCLPILYFDSLNTLLFLSHINPCLKLLGFANWSCVNTASDASG